MRPMIALAAAALLAGCQPSSDTGEPAAGEPASAPPPAAAPVVSPFEGDIDGRGNEPFWGVQIRATQITLSRPDHPNLVGNNAGPAVTGSTAVWQTQAGAALMKVTVAAQPGCSDGMSDLSYPLAVTVEVGGETLKGCGAKTGEMPTGEGQ